MGFIVFYRTGIASSVSAPQSCVVQCRMHTDEEAAKRDAVLLQKQHDDMWLEKPGEPEQPLSDAYRFFAVGPASAPASVTWAPRYEFYPIQRALQLRVDKSVV